MHQTPDRHLNSKRRKLGDSSPYYEENFQLSQEDFDALDELELIHSQKTPVYKEPLQDSKTYSSDSEALPRRGNVGPIPTFASASALQAVPPGASSPLRSPDTSIFASGTTTGEGFLGFQRASAHSTAESLPVGGGQFQFGFQTASKGQLVPSSAALARAQIQMRKWDEDDLQNAKPDSKSPPNSSPPRPPAVLQDSKNTQRSTLQPTSEPNKLVHPKLPSVSKLLHKPKPFKSPLIKGGAHRGSGQSSRSTLNPTGQAADASSTKIAPAVRENLPTASTETITPRKITPRFVTPFKVGMKPGEPGRLSLKDDNLPVKPAAPTSSPPRQSGKATLNKSNRILVFDLGKRPGRRSLKDWGFTPQRYTQEEFEGMTFNFAELDGVDVQNALHYYFYDGRYSLTPLPSTPPYEINPCLTLGVAKAHEYMLDKDCPLVTKAWVENHWRLILWKLAGMAAMDPRSETLEDTRRWGWRNVFYQLLYRYEREINQGARPPLRRIVSRDASPTCPMILCISDVFWPEGAKRIPGKEPHPEIELTDGWYRIRTEIDEPLARAARAGRLRMGRKLSVAGARLWSERKEPGEILECYDSVRLIINGNGCHLAPWHATLGFQRVCPIATMRSLTADGGMVPQMHLRVTQVLPLAFMEFVTEDGERVPLPTRSEAEEAAEVDKWTRRRENEHDRLLEESKKQMMAYENHASRLEQKAGPHFRLTEDGPPDNIDDLYTNLEDDSAAVFARVTPTEAGWLAHTIRMKSEAQQDIIRENIEKELNDLCPPRDVRSMRVIVAEDATVDRYPANRRAQVTIWDVMKYSWTEGKPGHLEPGDCFFVTSLHPTLQSSWMGQEAEAQIFLTTYSQSIWRRVARAVV